MQSTKIVQNQKGTALITALALGLIGSLLVAALWTMLRSSGSMVSDVTKYNQELAIGYGAAEYVMALIKNDELTCNGGNTCPEDESQTIDVPPELCTSLGKTNCDSLIITSEGYVFEEKYDFDDGTQILSAYSVISNIKIISKNESSLSTENPEQAILNITYKTSIDQ